MKSYIHLLLLVAIVSFASCNRMEKDIFDKPANQRVDIYMDSIANVLTSSPNGWEMMYFPNTSLPGFNILVKFDKGDIFSAAAKNETTTGNAYQYASGSLWRMLNNQGPCISFDTYNEVLHAFAEPTLPGFIKGVGMQGDYEFVVLNVSPDELLIKSKKRSTYNLLRRLDPAIGWEDYFTELEAAKGKIFNNHAILTAKVIEKEYTVYEGSTGILKAISQGKVFIDSLTTKRSFTFSREGLCLTRGLPNREDVRIFNRRGDEVYFSNGDVSFYVGNINKYIHEYCLNVAYGWRILPKNMGPELKAIVEDINEDLRELGGNKNDGITAINIGYKLHKEIDGTDYTLRTYVIQIAYKLSGVQQETLDFNINLNATNEAITFEYKKPTDNKARRFVEACPKVAKIFNYFVSGTFNATTDHPDNPTYGVTLTKIENGDANNMSWTEIK
ncbi:MAG: DUF4302 domain-containing protein [Paludibacteraceae bacterium]|nr:DUF4302 domain-containing protein [Paludibacteraceae bacterium]